MSAPRARLASSTTTLTASTTGEVVHAHSPSSSVIVPWNSSSRGPVGRVTTVSATPTARARDTACIWSGRRPQSASSSRLAVGVAPADLDQHVDAVRRREGDGGDHHRDRLALGTELAQPGERLITCGGWFDPVVACVAAQLLDHRLPRRVVVDHDQDDGRHDPRLSSAPVPT